jgi:hypothetical protein
MALKDFFKAKAPEPVKPAPEGIKISSDNRAKLAQDRALEASQALRAQRDAAHEQINQLKARVKELSRTIAIVENDARKGE